MVEEVLTVREFRGVWKGAVLRLGCVGVVCGAYLRFKATLTGDHFMPRIAPLDNSAINAPTPLSIALSVLQLHSEYLYRLVVPLKLSCDSSPNVLPNILDLSEASNVSWITAYAVLLSITAFAVRRSWQALTSPHILRLFCPYSRSLLTLA